MDLEEQQLFRRLRFALPSTWGGVVDPPDVTHNSGSVCAPSEQGDSATEVAETKAGPSEANAEAPTLPEPGAEAETEAEAGAPAPEADRGRGIGRADAETEAEAGAPAPETDRGRCIPVGRNRSRSISRGRGRGKGRCRGRGRNRSHPVQRVDLGPPPEQRVPLPPIPCPWRMPKPRRIEEAVYHEAVLRGDCVPGQLLLKLEPYACNARGHWLSTSFWSSRAEGVAPASLVHRGDNMNSLAVQCARQGGGSCYLAVHDILGFTYRMPLTWSALPWQPDLVVNHQSQDVPPEHRHYDSRLHCLEARP
jgi:hypothetical protein